MDINKLDSAIINIIDKKNKLSQLPYDSQDYDNIEEELHMLEDDFIEKYGDYFEEALETIHEGLCPDNDVLLPIAYLAQKYKQKGVSPEGKPVYEVDAKDGVCIDADNYKGKDTRLVLIPNPPRMVLFVNGKEKEVVWQAEAK